MPASNPPRRRNEQQLIEDAQLIWRNFSGVAKQYNVEGNRNFNIRLTEEMYNILKDKGANVKMKEPREEGGEPLYHIEVKVAYRQGGRPPKIIMITSGGRTQLDEETVGALDYSIIQKADLVINLSPYDVNGNTGIKAYLETAYVTIFENELDLMYAEQDERGPNADPNTVRFE